MALDENTSSILVYNEIAELYSEHYNSPSLMVDKFKSFLESGRVLDIGCGPGGNAFALSKSGFDVVGVDASKEMIKIASSKFPNIDFQIADVRDLSFPLNSFDGIFNSYCLVSMPKKQIAKVVKLFYDFLKPGGYLYFAHQGGKSVEIDSDPFFPDSFEHPASMFLSVYTLAELESLLVESGFEIKFSDERASEGNEILYSKLSVIAQKVDK